MSHKSKIQFYMEMTAEPDIEDMSYECKVAFSAVEEAISDLNQALANEGLKVTVVSLSSSYPVMWSIRSIE